MSPYHLRIAMHAFVLDGHTIVATSTFSIPRDDRLYMDRMMASRDEGDGRSACGIVSLCCDGCRKYTLSLHEEVHMLAMLVTISKFLQNFLVTFTLYNIRQRYTSVLSEHIFYFVRDK